MAKSSFWSDFKAFAMKGNVIDMAVGVVVGGAFGKIVSSLVDDIIMPLVGSVVGGVDFTKLKAVLRTTQVGDTVQEVCLNYGNFIQRLVDFLIVAFCIFLVIRAITKAASKFEKKEEPAPEEPAAPAPKPDDVVLLEEIRDLLKKDK